MTYIINIVFTLSNNYNLIQEAKHGLISGYIQYMKSMFHFTYVLLILIPGKYNIYDLKIK